MPAPVWLIQSQGHWSGISTLQDPHSNSPQPSCSSLGITPVLAGRFVRLDYTWDYDGKPQEGSLLMGEDAGGAKAHWVDTWHMGDKPMTLCGPPGTPENTLLKGSYAAPPGPDWGWRITLSRLAPDRFKIVMHNIWPEGKEELAVEALYQRP